MAEESAGGGSEEVIAGTLEELAPRFEDLNKADLAGRLKKYAAALRDGNTRRAGFLQSELFATLEKLKEALEEGAPLDEALEGKRASEALAELGAGLETRLDRSITARTVPLRLSIGPAPLITWKLFGSKMHPAPEPPSADIQTAGQRLSYFVFYVAGDAGHGESNIATANYYEISEEQLRRLQKGNFAPKALGQFPTEEAARLIAKASCLEPHYGQLLRELVIHAIFESQDWSLGLPQKEAPWDISFMYALRRYVAEQLLTKKGGEKVLNDTALRKVIQSRRNLQKVDWHPGQTRREIFEKWLTAMNNGSGDPALLDRRRKYIGDGILKAVGWKTPGPGATKEQQLQWRLRHWIAHHHYGALPARGLPYPTNTLLRFAFAKNPTDLDEDFRRGILEMIK